MDPSTVSRSTKSRRYTVNTSLIGENINNNFTPIGEGHQEQTFKELIAKISLDVGRCDYKKAWMSIFNFAIFPVFQILTSIGADLFKNDNESDTTKSIINVFRYITEIIPDADDILVLLMLNLFLTFIYFAYAIFFVYSVYKYKGDSFPSTLHVSSWIFVSRCIAPLFTCYFSFLTCKGLRLLLTNAEAGITAVHFAFGLPMLIVHFVLYHLTISIWHSTPIFRKNDTAQLWYCFSELDMQMNYIIVFNVFSAQLGVLVDGVAGIIVFIVLELIIEILSLVKHIYNLPYVQPAPNAFIICIFMTSIILTINPLINHFADQIFTYVLIVDVVVFIAFFYISRCIVSKRISSIINIFEDLHYDADNEEEDENDQFRLALLQPQKPKAPVDYSLINIMSPAIGSLFMRVGFMFNMSDINELAFVKYIVDSFSSPEVAFSAAQIAYAVQTNLIYIGEIQKICVQTSNKLPLSTVFITLLNEVRQELLTQLNKPLLEALHAAKKANTTLQSLIGDFWGAVLKQRTDAMLSTVPEISSEMDNASRLFQRLLRNYTRAPIVYRETTNFYHKSLGEHKLTVECQKQFSIKSKKGRTESNSSTNQGFDTDNTFVQHIEPAIAAQDVLEQMNSAPSNAFIFAFIASFIALIVCPIVVLVFGVVDMNSFSETFEPARVFSNTLYAVTRIPQLVRRKQLYLKGEIKEHKDETGPVRGTNDEFIPADNIVDAISKYTTQLKGLFTSILSSCKADAKIESLCSDKLYERKTGSSEASASSYDILSSFTNAAEKLLDLTEEEWKEVDTNQNAIFLFDNFDTLVSSIKEIMRVTNQQVVARQDEFKTKALVLYIVTWGVPLIIIIPITFFTLKAMSNELTFILKMFFCFPKNEISTLRWAMKASRNKSNKQEKAQRNHFSSDSLGSTEANNEIVEQVSDSLAGSSRTSSGMYTKYIQLLTIFGVVSCALTTAGVSIYSSSMLNILNVAYGYVMAVDSTASAVASYVWSQEVFSQTPINSLTIPVLKSRSLSYVKTLETTFDNFLYGSEDGMKAALLLGDDIITAYVKSTSVSTVNDKYEPSNGFLHSVYFSLSCDSQLRMLTESSQFIMNSSQSTHYTFSDEFVYHYEHLIFSHLDYCLNKGQDLILDKTNEIETSQLYQMLILFLSLFTIQFLFYFTVNLSVFIDARHHHRTVRRLLLLIPPEAMLKGQMIVKWISGNVNYRTYNRMRDAGKANNGNSISQEFIVNNSKGGLILTDSDFKVTLVNSTACTMFKSQKEDLIGHNLVQLFQSQLIDKDKAETIRVFEKETGKMKTGHSRSNTCSFNSSILGTNNQLMYILVTVVGHSDDSDTFDSTDGSVIAATSFSVVVQDRTSEHFQEALVASEKAKGEKLIESLLPPSIVKRMNEGETDITFEVQQATCLFTSIVGWADLTKNMSATQVVGLLNELFCAYDEELHNFPAITKVKTIGHIYMCCGGLFSDTSVNSAQVVVDYAVKLLEISAKVSKDLGISFQITCGVNTGGPLKCGILGVTRPVFDIIGDVVNVSSRMNSHCLPGYVQVSPTTYDAIKFLQFNIKERGEIQVKGKGMLKTYLVSPPANNQF